MRAVLVARVGSAAWRTVSVHARVGDRVELAVELVEGRHRRPLPLGAHVRFDRIAPRMQHVETPPPNDGVNGTLDADDLLRHMTPRGLLDRRLAEEAPIRFRVWRFRR